MIADLLKAAGSWDLANVPEGLDALLIKEIAAASDGRGATHLHIARDDARMNRLCEALAFFAPEVEVLAFPAWDCLPYDRISPHRDLLAERITTLCRLLEAEQESGPATGRGRVVVTTVNAALQRVLAKETLRERHLQLRVGGSIPMETLFPFFEENGYQRVDTVEQPGEYAQRGGLLDLFPAGSETPYRVDLFGDEIESIRSFDPLDQRSTGKVEAFQLRPVNEVFLTPESVRLFRTRYREAFGAVTKEDPLYEAISERRAHPGMEHWLPLFHERLETLFDYLGEASVSLDHQAGEVRDTRLEQIQDFYQAREGVGRAQQVSGSVYHPLPPEALYLSAEDWQAMLAERAGLQFHSFNLPEHAERVRDAEGRHARDFSEARTASEGALYDAVTQFVAAELAAQRRVLITAYSTGSRDRLLHVLEEHGLAGLSPCESWAEVEALPADRIACAVLSLERGFGSGPLTVLTETDILGERIARGSAKKRKAENFLTEVSTLGTGDFVVHVDHGVGRYDGLEALDVGGAPHDCLRVLYHGGDKLFVPVENIEVLSRYGSHDLQVELDRLGQGNWQARKARVKKRLKDMADQLIRIAAERHLKTLESMAPPEGLYDEFSARFPYPETDDQLRAIEDVVGDLSDGRPMDRLICGDVGFGKTEVALRAAFVAAMSGRQVAVVVPTTLLARQHFETFGERFHGLPIRVAQLSRLVSHRDATRIKEELKTGQLDIVIGTHALLAKSIGFRDLGLLIVDEEQHFGVKQKERLKELRAEVHVLTLTATPIPRTLQLALSGVRDMSLIATPPVDRLAVRTFVLPYDPVVVREAIMRERNRGGQIFYVCPRIEDLAEVEERLHELVPEVRIGVAHGRLSPSALESVMGSFMDRKFDLLLSTNIVESGLDIPNANTMIMHRADMFGLAQLYQLRGRIGRSKQRGYAYLTVRPGRSLTQAAEKRLHVMQTLDSLGAGFTLASHDLDIRGGGNLLGEEQSGHIREVGVELYQQMLEEAVSEARSLTGEAAGEGAGGEAWTPQINLGTSVLIPEGYVVDLQTRLGLYRRLSTLIEKSELEAFAAELIDRFGPLPDEVQNLLHVMEIKHLCKQAGVEKLEVGPKGAVVSFREDSFARPEKLIALIQRQAGILQLRPDHKLVYRRSWETSKLRTEGARRFVGALAKIAA